MKVKYICSECGSENVLIDVWPTEPHAALTFGCPVRVDLLEEAD